MRVELASTESKPNAIIPVPRFSAAQEVFEAIHFSHESLRPQQIPSNSLSGVSSD